MTKEEFCQRVRAGKRKAKYRRIKWKAGVTMFVFMLCFVGSAALGAILKSSEVQGDLNITGQLNVSGDTYVYGNTSLAGNLNVSGNSSLSGQLNISENLTASKDIVAKSNITLNGTILDSDTGTYYWVDENGALRVCLDC